ncbi:hypothetical protein R3P38DRAFT_2616734 [Favolaschia claudopus]|uniref:F-box domain-containing protein n=1 Tax=Favolaschia claudopus TaxID=2862362 RepID=A0AAW0C9Y8_9AGAR
MHYSSCLKIPEIVQLIVQNLRLPDRDLDRHALAALACTSRTFSAVALDDLWRTLDSLEPILYCMPPDLFGGRGEDRLLRPMKASDWDRPRIYTNRVKHLNISNHCLVPADIFPALNASLWPGEVESYFRKLTAVRWINEHDLINIRFLLSSKLKNLSLEFPSSHTNFSLLSSIPLVCPGLEKLRVNSPLPDGTSISELIHGLHSLQKLHITIPDRESLEHLSRLKGLTSFTCSLPNTLPILCNPLSFVALEEVTILNSNLKKIIHLFSRCSLPVLKRLKITANSGTTTAGVEKLHKVLSRSCAPSSLTTIEVDLQEDDAGEHPELYMIPFCSFEPLFCFVNLTSISIASKSGIRLHDEEMEIIARAWPRLRSLDLWERVECQTLSLRSLSIIAEHCPVLETLALSLNTTVIPELPPSDGRQPISQQLALHELDVNRSPISAPSLLTGRFLSSIFPNLSVVTSELDKFGLDELGEDEDSELTAYHGLWKEVESQLSVFKAIRQEERARVLAELESTREN